MAEFIPLRKKLKRAETGREDNFVPPYLPEPLREAAADTSWEAEEKVRAPPYRGGGALCN